MADYYVGNVHATDDYLAHYGVLGMKWGVRKSPDSYRYESHATKKYKRKAEKAEAQGQTEKASIYRNRANRSAKLDAREMAYSKRVTTRGNILSRAVSPVGSKPYVQILSMMNRQNTKGVNAHKAVAAILSHLGGRLLSSVMKAAYIRGNNDMEGLSNAMDKSVKFIKSRK